MKLSLFFLAALAWGQDSHVPLQPLPNATEDMRPRSPAAEQQIAALKQENAQLRDALRILGERHDKIAMSLNGCLGPLPQVPPPAKPKDQ